MHDLFLSDLIVNNSINYMKITFYGHASIGIEVGGKHILVDPFISANPLAENVDINTIKADYILLTHAHGDQDVEAIAERTKAVIVSNAEIALLCDQRVSAHPMNHGGSWNFDFGKVKYVNAIHSSSFPDGTNGGNPGGFVIEGEHKTSTSREIRPTMDMKLIPMRTKLIWLFCLLVTISLWISRMLS
jgi:L-ascorbate metabolism protein UlaG (beta-lactamase superfamily)